MLEFKLIYGLEGYEKAKGIRDEVFIVEQGFPYDYDEKDDISFHIVGYDKEKTIAAARLYKRDDGFFVIGRVVVKKDYRKQYIGDTLLRALEDKVVNQMGTFVVVMAIESAVGFYEKEGYQKTGKTEVEEGLLHFEMVKDLSKPFKRCDCCGKR